eukprot:Anaeramoba_ignava/a613745_8.p1 GENE.a613745_8~~a613745_8.p1  ORF type:complete len:155 (-),score=47.64 a613745_8:18-482(-)
MIFEQKAKDDRRRFKKEVREWVKSRKSHIHFIPTTSSSSSEEHRYQRKQQFKSRFIKILRDTLKSQTEIKPFELFKIQQKLKLKKTHPKMSEKKTKKRIENKWNTLSDQKKNLFLGLIRQQKEYLLIKKNQNNSLRFSSYSDEEYEHDSTNSEK